MSLRLFLPAACSLCLSLSFAHAQTAPAPPATTELPMPPLTVPFNPVPLDTKTQGVLDAKKVRQFVIQLKELSAPVVAFWIDPQNNPAPPGAARGFIAKPTGIDRVVPQGEKTLLVFGTEEGVKRLQTVVSIFDAPFRLEYTLFDARIYWIDSSVPSSKDYKAAVPQVRAALADELEALDQLKEEDRAVLQPLSQFQTANRIPAFLSFASNGSEQPSRTLRSMTPPFFNPNIDPGMPILPDKSLLPLERSRLRLTPILQENNGFVIDIQGKAILDSTVTLKNGESLILTGAPSSFQIQAPSPRFDSFVLVITPRPLVRNLKVTPPLP